ncbi:hypothetical protein [Aestuariibius sp. HNIBRBA575]|uniref:hypothetical protein n=1 Tax=Aestuariibius sp. HNIBRBA575 TaxID=3233343 RepID=UPI0034A4DFAA
MFKKIVDLFRPIPPRTSPRPKTVIAQGNHIENLAAHPEVTHAPISQGQTEFDLPVWVDHPADADHVDTYAGLFWDVEPMGEYLYYLSGKFLKNDKGLLRFRTAPIETRVERNFEVDVMEVASLNAMDDQFIATQTAADLSDIAALDVATAANMFVPKAFELGQDRWMISLSGPGINVHSGVARLMLGLGPDDAPFVEILYQRQQPKGPDVPHASLISVFVFCTDATANIGALAQEFEALRQRYRDMPYRALTGAIRM